MEKFTGYVREPFYYETDQMGIIHHSNYIRWFEEARVALLVHLGFPYKNRRIWDHHPRSGSKLHIRRKSEHPSNYPKVYGDTVGF